MKSPTFSFNLLEWLIDIKIPKTALFLILWAKSKPSNTEFVLFSRKYKMSYFNHVTLKEVELSQTDSAKYILLDRNLSWKSNIYARTTKVITATYICTKPIESTWELNPTTENLIYDAITPILFYGASLWWNVLEVASNCA